MSRVMDLVGQRFGRWIVLRQAENGKRRQTRWHCRCDCGNERIVHASNLRSGGSKSCGCLARELSIERESINETGNQYGRWTVVRQVESDKQGAHWLCQCSCGETRIVDGSSLRSGDTQSCGCLARELSSERRLINEIGKRYGRWAVVGRGKNDGGKHGADWLCRCDCGTEREVGGARLRDGTSQSCGCLARELLSLPDGEAAFNALFSVLQGKAKARGYEWALTKKQVADLTKRNCYYCGVEPRQVKRIKGNKWPYTYNGIDRVDNEKGYILSNAVACCGTCNKAKNAMTLNEFTSWIHQVHEHLSSRGQ